MAITWPYIVGHLCRQMASPGHNVFNVKKHTERKCIHAVGYICPALFVLRLINRAFVSVYDALCPKK